LERAGTFWASTEDLVAEARTVIASAPISVHHGARSENGPSSSTKEPENKSPGVKV
jgi:hypothetical protein